MTRTATCGCGALRVVCENEPVRVSMCHCWECQKRTGSAFGAQARFQEKDVHVEGTPREWTRKGDAGSLITFRFCGTCGSTVYWTIDKMPGFVAIALGAFASHDLPAPSFSVYEARKHAWLDLPRTIETHMD